MKYYKYILFTIVSFFLSILITFASDFEITGKNVILYNLNESSILYEKNAHEKTPIASLTKIMTSIIALENIDDLNETLILNMNDFLGLTGYAEAGFKIYEKVTYLDLLYGILLPSGAEAVNAIVNHTLGYEEFIKAMNEKAKELNLKNTSFSNAIGKDEEKNYSTASDLAQILLYALKNETFKKIFTTDEYTASNGLKLKKTISVYKNILDISKIDGAKSGFTSKAGRCLASITSLNDVDYLLVVINSDKEKNYNAVLDTITIYDYYSTNYGYQTIINDDTFIKTIPVKWSKTKEYTITGNEEVTMYLKNNPSITYKYEGIEEIEINTKKETKLGIVSIYNDNELLKEYPVYLEEDIKYYQPIYLIIIPTILIIMLFICLRIFKKKHRKSFSKKRK